MKHIKFILIITTLLVFSCTEIERIINEVAIINPTDSTYVDDNKNLKKESSNVQKIEEWEVYGNSKYDENKTFDDKEGSFKLSKVATSWENTDKVISKNKISIESGKTYQIKFRSYTESWPPPTIHVTVEYHNNKRLFNEEGSYFSNSNAGKWEENTLIFSVLNNSDIKYIIPKISMLPKIGRNSDIWIDEMNFSEYNYQDSKVGDKIPFNGSLTRVDNLGNVEILKNGEWKSIFIFGIYADKNRSDWNIYSQQGFNTNMWASSSADVQRGKRAGLYSNLQIGQYVIDVDWLKEDNIEKINHLEKIITEIKNEELMNDVIFYYIDNEFYDIPEQLVNVTKKINLVDRDINENRMHPIYMLNGAYGQARKYNNLVDITGTYVAVDRTDRSIGENFTGLQINENQKLPAVIAQINRGVGLNFRPVLFSAIAKGAKGLGFWRDGGSGVDITKEPWWNDFPKIVNEITQMMPIIKESHITNWGVKCSSDQIVCGTRMYKNKGYLIIANPTELPINACYTVENLSYEISSVKDYFNESVISIPQKNVFTMPIAAHDSKVVRLD